MTKKAMFLRSKTLRTTGAFGLALASVIGGCAVASDDHAANKAQLGEPASALSDAEAVPGTGDFTLPSHESTGPVLEASIATPTGEMPVKYRLVGEEAVFEGDQLLPTVGGVVMSATSVGRQWPDARVPYVIDANLPGADRVTSAVAHWEAKTRLRFIPRTTERDYVHFRSGSGCSSNIGQMGGRQTVNLITGEAASSVQTVGIERTAAADRVHFFYKRGFATRGSVIRANALSNHFRYIVAPGKAVANIVSVAFGANGHAFAYYDDATVSEGTAEDFAAFAMPRPYALAAGKTVADVASITIDDLDKGYAFYTDGTFSIGGPTDLARDAAPEAYVVADGKTPADLAHVSAGKGGAFYAFYNEMQTPTDGGFPDGGVAGIRALSVTSGTPQQLSLIDNVRKVSFPGHCGVGATIHEIGHAVGLFHEQTRHDRDGFVRIEWDNIDPASRFNFEKHSRVVGSDTGVYDFGSIMHYGPKAFSANGKDTIVPLSGGTFTEQREALSEGDIVGVQAMYP